jgi:hypothetical protein
MAGSQLWSFSGSVYRVRFGGKRKEGDEDLGMLCLALEFHKFCGKRWLAELEDLPAGLNIKQVFG